MGVCRVDTEEELRRIYTKVVADMGRAVVTSGALVYAPESGETGASSKAFDVVMMMEQYLDGPEVDVDIVLSDGRAVYAEVTDNWPTIEPYFQEVGANCPSVLTRTQQDELIQLSVAATLSLGFTCGVFHVESKYTSSGARLIEVNCRYELRGRCASMPRQALSAFPCHCAQDGRHAGAQHQPAHLGSGLGGGAPAHRGGPAVAAAARAGAQGGHQRNGVQRAALRSHEGPVLHRRVDGASHLFGCFLCVAAVLHPALQITHAPAPARRPQKHPSVVSARPLVAAGELVTGPDEGMPTWYAEIVVTFDTVKEGMDFLYAIDAQWRKEGGLPIVPK